jgi:hypothetical protein
MVNWRRLLPKRSPPSHTRNAHVQVRCDLKIVHHLGHFGMRRRVSEVEIQRIEKHVVSCSECQDRLQEEVDLAAAMRSSTAAKIGKIVKAEKKRTPQR